jgi:predicted ATPase
MHIRQVILHPDKYPSRDCYPFNLRIFQKTVKLSFDRPVTFFAGENGTGKSTLLKAICQKSGIHIWEDTEGARYKQFTRAGFQYIDVDKKARPVHISAHRFSTISHAIWINGPTPTRACWNTSGEAHC